MSLQGYVASVTLLCNALLNDRSCCYLFAAKDFFKPTHITLLLSKTHPDSPQKLTILTNEQRRDYKIISNNHIEELVDIAVYPDVYERAGKQIEVTIGDLHVNSLKFLYFLIREGILDMPKQGYEQFNEIYKKKPNQITATDIAMLNLNLILATVNPNPPKVRIMGDEIFDRGSNDYFVLKLFVKNLAKNKYH